MLVKIERNEFEEFFEDYNDLKSIINFLLDNVGDEEEVGEIIDKIGNYLRDYYNISLHNYKDYFKEEFKENRLLEEYFEEYEQNVYYSKLREFDFFDYSRDWEKEIGRDKVSEIDTYVYGISYVLEFFEIELID